MYIHRIAESAVTKSINNFPVTAITGPANVVNPHL
jgi:hypothetical protein